MGVLVFGPPGTGPQEVAAALAAAGIDAEAWDGTAPYPEAEEGESLDGGRWEQLVRATASLEGGPRRPLAAAEGWAAVGSRLHQARQRGRLVLDTTHLSPQRLRAFLQGLPPGWISSPTPVVVVESFSFARGVPLDLDYCLDARGLRNPYWEPDLRALSGTDPRVSRYVLEQPQAEGLLRAAEGLAAAELDRGSPGSPLLRLTIGCTGGRHRSVALAEELVRRLEGLRRRCVAWHRDLDD